VIAALVGVMIAYQQLHQQTSSEETDRAAKRLAAIRRQAGAISAVVGETLPPDGEARTRIVLYNRSSAPVRNAVVTLVILRGSGPRSGREMAQMLRNEWQRYLNVIPPGRSDLWVGAGWEGMMRQPGVELAFTDQAGRHWLCAAAGKLVQLHETPEKYYGLDKLHEALPWEDPRPLG
jgi:hypothetical protein